MHSYVFIGLASALFVSEFSYDGELLLNGRFPARVRGLLILLLPVDLAPERGPAMAVEGGPDEKVKLYASWNGATEVESWELLAGPDAGRLEPVGSVPWDGFETAKLVQTSHSHLAVRVRNRFGQARGTSAPVTIGAKELCCRAGIVAGH